MYSSYLILVSIRKMDGPWLLLDKYYVLESKFAYFHGFCNQNDPTQKMVTVSAEMIWKRMHQMLEPNTRCIFLLDTQRPYPVYDRIAYFRDNEFMPQYKEQYHKINGCIRILFETINIA